MLVLTAIGLYVVWPSLVATFSSVDELKHVAPGWFVVMAVVRGAQLRLHVAADRSVPGLPPVLRDRDRAGRGELCQQGGARRQRDGRGDAVPHAGRRGDGRRADRDRHGGGLADQRCDVVRAAGARGPRDRRRRRGQPRARSGGLARRGDVRAAVGGGAVLLLFDRPIGRVASAIQRIHNAAVPAPPADGGSRGAVDDGARHGPGDPRPPVAPGDPALGGERPVRLSRVAGGARRLGRRGPAPRWSCSHTSRRSCWA